MRAHRGSGPSGPVGSPLARTLAAVLVVAPLVLARGEGPSLRADRFTQPAAISASCPEPGTPPSGRLGAVAYIRAKALHVVDVAAPRSDRTLVPAGSGDRREIGSVRWSPDGRWIAFGRGEVVPAGGGATCLALGQRVRSWSWSPTADVLVGATSSGGVIAGGPGLPVRELLPPGWGESGVIPVIDPSGRFVAVSRVRVASGGLPAAGSLWIVDLSDGDARALRWSKGALPIVAGWSPDGRWVLWWNDEQFSGSVAADGIALRATSVDRATMRAIAPRVLVYPDFLSWCGGRLVVAAGGFRDVRSDKRLIAASPPSWRASELSRDPSLSWIWPACSPGGRWVAATAGAPPPPPYRFGRERRTIWLVALDGSERRQLLGASTYANELARWSSDGRSILFVHRSLGPQRRAYLFLATIDPASGTLLRTNGPVAALGRSAFFYYGYYPWSSRTDWYQPTP